MAFIWCKMIKFEILREKLPDSDGGTELRCRKRRRRRPRGRGARQGTDQRVTIARHHFTEFFFLPLVCVCVPPSTPSVRVYFEFYRVSHCGTVRPSCRWIHFYVRLPSFCFLLVSELFCAGVGHLCTALTSDAIGDYRVILPSFAGSQAAIRLASSATVTEF